MVKLLSVLIIALVFEAVGVVLLSAGLKELGEVPSLSAPAIGRMVRRGLTHPKILLGVLFELIFFGFLLVLLKRNDVSLVWPLTSLGFLLTALSARFLLHEQISIVRWIGVLLIVAGAGLVSWSEKARPAAPGVSPGPHSTSTSTADRGAE